MDRSPRNNKEEKQVVQGKKHFQWWHLLIILGIAGTHLLALGLGYHMAFIGGLCFEEPPGCPPVPDWYSTVSGLGMILLFILDFPLGYMIPLIWWLFPHLPSSMQVVPVGLNSLLWGWGLFFIGSRLWAKKACDGSITT
jgi:hypothetical protein